MRKNRLFTGVLLVALCCLVFTGCESESDSDPVITFEDVNLGENGYWNGSDLSGVQRNYESYGEPVTEYAGSFKSGDLTCNNLYNATYHSWSGIACSSHIDMDSIGVGNQYSVYATSGAGGSKKFAVICPFDSSGCSFSQEMTIKSLMINNATYAYLAIKEGKDGYKNDTKFTAEDCFYITITGYDANGKKTSDVVFYLADFRNGKNYICANWTKVELESLGKIKSLSFKLTSTDMSWGYMDTPGYACIDNIVYTK